jgi:hypothetical protein
MIWFRGAALAAMLAEIGAVGVNTLASWSSTVSTSE